MRSSRTNAATATDFIAIQYSMPYPEFFVEPMRQELTQLGIQELRTPADVDAAVTNESGTLMIVVNSVCGCAAGAARPALTLALRHPVLPDELYTVFSGQDVEATARARSYFSEYQPSSPSIALLRDAEVVFFMHRHQIEGRSPEAIGADLKAAFDRCCGAKV